MSRILLVRHALCDPVGRSLAGRAPGVHLNHEGRSQADRLGRALREVPVAAVYSSPLERARETAAAIAGPQDLEVAEATGLNEVDFGEWTGRSFADLEGDERWGRFNSARSITRIPGGEMMLEVQARAVAELLSLAEHHREAVVVAVSHGDVLRSVLAFVLGLSLDQMHRLEVDPASVSTIEVQPWGARVLAINDRGFASG